MKLATKQNDDLAVRKGRDKDAVPEITEEQVAKVIAETIRRREAEQTQLMNLMRERAQSNPMIFRLNRAIQEAWKEPLKVKPRSKRGQRVRRWR